MKKYMIVNLMDSSITIEDCGLTLPSKGSTATITEHQIKYSKDIMKMKGMINIRGIRSAGIWPITNEPVLKEESQSVPYHVAQKVIQEDLVIQMLKKLDKLTDVLSRMPEMPVRMASGSGSPTDKQKEPYQSQDEEPIFIPSSIVPKDTVANINSTSDSSDRSDIDDVSNLLKTLRAAKKRSK